MKKISKSQKFMEYILDHPASKVGTVAKKFGITPALGYQLRKKARENQIGVFAPPEMLPVPELPDPPINVVRNFEFKGTPSVDATLNARAENYGKFKDGAALMQAIKRSMAAHAAKHDKTFADDQWEALEMIVHKIGRIVNGNPDVVDHWVDIAGYATLIADRLQGRDR
jgi:hypothetical protein